MDSKISGSWNLQTRISKLLLNEASSDTEFLIGEPPERYLCHKAILAAGSPVFETMFFGTMKQESPIRVPDVTSNGFSLMLQYLYSDSISIQDESDAFEAAYSAKKYMIKSMFAICEKFLMDNLVFNTKNIFSIYEEASFLEMKKLQACCLRYVSRNAKEIFLSESFLRISKNTCIDILRLNFMNIESEMEIIEALWLWGVQQCREKGVKCIDENIREYTKEFLKYVRFFTLSMEELINVLKKYQILDTSDELAVLWNFAMPSTMSHQPVPPNICTESKTRSLGSSRKIHFAGIYRCDSNMTTYLTENSQMDVEITVTGSPVTVIGAVIAFKPIPCYSYADRSLIIEMHANNCSSTSQARVKLKFKVDDTDSNAEQQQVLLLDDYITVEEEEILIISVIASGEGVKFMQYSEETLHYDFGKSKIGLKLDHSKAKNNKLVFPMKELMIM